MDFVEFEYEFKYIKMNFLIIEHRTGIKLLYSHDRFRKEKNWILDENCDRVTQIIDLVPSGGGHFRLHTMCIPQELRFLVHRFPIVHMDEVVIKAMKDYLNRIWGIDSKRIRMKELQQKKTKMQKKNPLQRRKSRRSLSVSFNGDRGGNGIGNILRSMSRRFLNSISRPKMEQKTCITTIKVQSKIKKVNTICDISTPSRKPTKKEMSRWKKWWTKSKTVKI